MGAHAGGAAAANMVVSYGADCTVRILEPRKSFALMSTINLNNFPYSMAVAGEHAHRYAITNTSANPMKLDDESRSIIQIESSCSIHGASTRLLLVKLLRKIGRWRAGLSVPLALNAASTQIH